MILPPTSEISHHHKVTNTTMSPTSLSPPGFSDFDHQHPMKKMGLFLNCFLKLNLSEMINYEILIKIQRYAIMWTFAFLETVFRCIHVAPRKSKIQDFKNCLDFPKKKFSNKIHI